MQSHPAAPGLDCWLPIKKLLLKMTALFALVLVTQCGCSKSPKSFQEMSDDEQLNYLRAQADGAMLVQVTNGVRNIHDILEENADTYGGSVGQWRGWVRLDFVDQSGGLQQTNIPMTFVATFDGRLFGRPSGNTRSALLDIN